MAEEEPRKLEIDSVIGFSGCVPGGLVLHPDGTHAVYPLGSTVVIRELGNLRASLFLQGHSNKVSCLAVSPSGRYVASGQITHMGFQADVIVWDFEERRLLHRLTLHKVKVETLAFSHDEHYLATVGGEDDKQLVVWDVASGKAVCGSVASNEETFCVEFFNNDSSFLVTSGRLSLRVWEMDTTTRKLVHADAALGKLKRTIRSICLSADDSTVYCGTESGDVLSVSIAHGAAKNLKTYGPRERFAKGATAIRRVGDGDDLILVGGGDGTVSLLNARSVQTKKSTSVLGGVTSLSPHPLDGALFFVGTTSGNMYLLRVPELEADLRLTCHCDPVNDVTFPFAYSELFATCSAQDVRVWNARTCGELLRITVPNVTCNCVTFSRDGSLILSGWGDGKIRAFGPQSGKLLWVINDAHVLHHRRTTGPLVGVTAITPGNAAGGELLVSGGSDGQVRVWQITKTFQKMIASMKEHKGTVNAVRVLDDDKTCVSASDDGSCIVWDLRRHARANVMYSQTFFKGVAMLPDESQFVTAGTDRKVTFWDATDCSTIREVEASPQGEVLGVDVAPGGLALVSCGQDRFVRLWDYDEGVVTAIGVGHSGSVTKVKFSPDEKRIVSVGDDGGVFIWEVAP